MSLNRHQRPFPVLSGMSDDVITDNDVITHVLTSKQHSIDQKSPKRRFRRFKAKFGQKGMKSFHSFSRTVFEFPISI